VIYKSTDKMVEYGTDNAACHAKKRSRNRKESIHVKRKWIVLIEVVDGKIEKSKKNAKNDQPG
jgi:hypothetical protein